MNPDPPIAFDPSEELANFGDENQEYYGLSARTFFYLIVTCRAAETFAGPAFSIEPIFSPPKLTPAGAVVEFVVGHAFWIEASSQRLRLWALQADGAGDRWMVFEGDSSNPQAWESLLKAVGRVEHFGVFLPHADRLRHMWTTWLSEQERRRGERGF